MEPERVTFSREESFRQVVEQVFVEQFRRLRELLPDAQVEHVGSTAVPGSVTKGDLDICVIVEREQFPLADALLDRQFGRNFGSDCTRDFSAFVDGGASVPVGIQLVVRGSELDCFVRWRDLLRSNLQLRQAYDDLKRRYDHLPMEEYQAAKSRFIEEGLFGR
jgi:GrpB-like predicted nucleotidyltransferase (UPF0157 family)